MWCACLCRVRAEAEAAWREALAEQAAILAAEDQAAAASGFDADAKGLLRSKSLALSEVGPQAVAAACRDSKYARR